MHLLRDFGATSSLVAGVLLEESEEPHKVEPGLSCQGLKEQLVPLSLFLTLIYEYAPVQVQRNQLPLRSGLRTAIEGYSQ